MTHDPNTLLEPLRAQIHEAARAFESDAQSIATLLHNLVEDVERVTNETLEIIPVAHHSPASAVHALQRISAKTPRVIFIELSEDLCESIDQLKDCTLPIALQAFANSSEDFPQTWLPLSVIAPLTEFSAEFQAIAYALNHKDVEVVFVDRSVDHIFQWLPQEDDAVQDLLPNTPEDAAEEDEEEHLHSTSIGLEMGSLEPTFGAFKDFLLENARVSHFSEWWDLYVEQPTLGASYDAWRQAMILVGSLIRRIGTQPEHLDNHRKRESYMWTRMKEWLKTNNVPASEAVYICGAAHAASDVPEYGADNPTIWEIPPRSKSEWLYGFIPSSYSAIERQFGHPRGTVSLAEATWKKAISALDLKPMSLSKRSKPRTKKATKPKESDQTDVTLLSILTRPPELAISDTEQLLRWCTDLVALARKNRYLASTADAIAIYETSTLLASIRGRQHPSPYDFIDAAITCLEKTEVPGKRSVQQLCGILLGADRVGMVGYSSLPPLVKDVFDRLAPLGVTPRKKTITRSLMDFRKGNDEELKPCSDLLWRIHYLLPKSSVARPIMGERKLGGKQLQESWDIKTAGSEQRALIELAYEGVTIEQVLESRLQKYANTAKANAVDALSLAEDSILYLDNIRLTQNLGERALDLLTQDLGAQNAVQVFRCIRRLVHYYRSTPTGLPEWLKNFVSTGYQHYATLLPTAFSDRGTTPQQLAGMLSFLFNLESLALSMGCNRSQVIIALQQAIPITTDPVKVGLLWACQWVIHQRDATSVRHEFDLILSNDLTLPAFPNYLSGFLLALNFTSLVTRLAVELITRAFSTLPDSILMPWLPGLITNLKESGADVLPGLFKEAFQSLPSSLPNLDSWTPPWEHEAAAEKTALSGPELSPENEITRTLLLQQRDTANAFAAALNLAGEWLDVLPSNAPSNTGPSLSPENETTRTLLLQHHETGDTFAKALSLSGEWLDALPSIQTTTSPNPSVGTAKTLLSTHPETLDVLSKITPT